MTRRNRPVLSNKMSLWTRPKDYIGEKWYDWYVFLSRHRDSSIIENSNFEAGLEELGGESDTIVVVRDRHWAVGWVEWIGIHKSDRKAIEKADEMLERLEDYPVLDEDEVSRREWEAFHAFITDEIHSLERSLDIEPDLTDEEIDSIIDEYMAGNPHGSDLDGFNGKLLEEIMQPYTVDAIRAEEFGEQLVLIRSHPSDLKKAGIKSGSPFDAEIALEMLKGGATVEEVLEHVNAPFRNE